MTSKATEFVVETSNHCFLCLNPIRINSDLKQEEESRNTVYSMQHLSRYLKLDMRKVFQGPVPQHLLEKVERSRLKVELCSECSSLNRKLAGLFEQLESIKMEIAFWVCSVSAKIRDSEESQKLELIKNQFENHNEDSNVEDILGKLEIAQVLREETNRKCSIKLSCSNSNPKIRLEKFEWKEPIPNANVFGKILTNLETCETQNIPTTDQIKTENPSFSTDEANDTDDDDFLNFGAADDYGHPSSPSSHSSSQSDETSNRSNIKRKTVRKERKPESSSSLVTNKSRQDKKFSKIGKTNRNFPAVPSPIKSGPGGTVKKGDIANKRIINAENGRYKCRLCSKEYVHSYNFWRHFKSVHMKVSYACPIPDCGKSFSQRIQYEIHYQSIHLGIRYRCQSCFRTFVQKYNLVHHVKTAHPKLS